MLDSWNKVKTAQQKFQSKNNAQPSHGVLRDFLGTTKAKIWSPVDDKLFYFFFPPIVV
jgi:hypothetical protein